MSLPILLLIIQPEFQKLLALVLHHVLFIHKGNITVLFVCLIISTKGTIMLLLLHLHLIDKEETILLREQLCLMIIVNELGLGPGLCIRGKG